MDIIIGTITVIALLWFSLKRLGSISVGEVPKNVYRKPFNLKFIWKGVKSILFFPEKIAYSIISKMLKLKPKAAKFLSTIIAIIFWIYIFPKIWQFLLPWIYDYKDWKWLQKNRPALVFQHRSVFIFFCYYHYLEIAWIRFLFTFNYWYYHFFFFKSFV